jgi:hypothetical protein
MVNKQPILTSPLRTTESITLEESNMLQNKYRSQYIPDYIVFDGENYADFEGHTFATHPNLDMLKQMYVEELNKEIKAKNETLTAKWKELISLFKLEEIIAMPLTYL